MKLALAIIGAALVATTTKFGPAALHADNWPVNFEYTFKKAKFKEMFFPDAALIKVALNPVPHEEIQESLAALRPPEGPQPPPPDVSMETLCETLASAARTHGIPTGFFARLIWQESRFQQRIVSHAGAQGVAQFMPMVAVSRGLRNPFDALESLPHSARFLREHLDYFGNLGLAAAAYNGGARRVTDWLARRGRLPQETRDYVKIITGHAPERWTEPSEIDLPVNLPQHAPCEGVADLSREAEPAKIAVKLEPQVAKIVENARIAAAKARLAAAKSNRGRLLARGRGGREEPSRIAIKVREKPRLPAKIADRAPTDRSSGAGKVRVAETSAAKR
jgi:hypothetical protein